MSQTIGVTEKFIQIIETEQHNPNFIKVNQTMEGVKSRLKIKKLNAQAWKSKLKGYIKQ